MHFASLKKTFSQVLLTKYCISTKYVVFYWRGVGQPVVELRQRFSQLWRRRSRPRLRVVRVRKACGRGAPRRDVRVVSLHLGTAVSNRVAFQSFF